MRDYDPELEAFKSKIDLREFAAYRGYALDRKESWRGSAVMRHANGDKIIIKRDTDDHYVYFSVRDDRDNGSIIDFLQRRERLTLGGVRVELREWLNEDYREKRPVQAFLPLQPTAKDRMVVETAYARMREADRHPYLEEERKIPTAVLQDARFLGRIRIDIRGNAVFPHFDLQGLCGYELKNRGFTGFAKGGEKGLWWSHARAGDTRLVFAESAIDAMSYHVLHPDEARRYASIGGKPNPVQPELVKAAIRKMPAGAEIISAMDADADGRALAGMVEEALRETGRTDATFRRDEPPQAKDWNDALRALARP